MNSPAHDIALFIAGTIGGFGQKVFVASEPATPDEVVTVYDYPGAGADTDEMDLQPNFQVRVRSPDYQSAYNLQVIIRASLEGPVAGIVAETSIFSIVYCISDIASLGRDGNQRYLLVASYRARRTKKET